MFEIRDWNKFLRVQNESKNDQLHEGAEKDYGTRTHESMTRDKMAFRDVWARSKSIIIGVLAFSFYK